MGGSKHREERISGRDPLRPAPLNRKEPMTDRQLIRAAIDASGLTPREFAERLMGRVGRTIRRWLTGEVAIPPEAKGWLERWLAITDTQRQRIIAALAPRATGGDFGRASGPTDLLT